MAKVKETLLKTTIEKQRVIYKGTPIMLSADLSEETLQSRREWHDIFKVLKGKNLQNRILYPARLSFQIEGERKNFSDKQKLREFIIIRPAAWKMLKEVLQVEMKGH